MTRHDAGLVGVVAGVAALHAWFVSVDTRLPGDRALMFQDLSRARSALHEPELLGDVATSVTGWYQLLLAVALEAFGASTALFLLPGLVSSVAIVACTGLVARKVAGPAAGLASAAVVGVVPMVVDMGRILWFHVPEAALVMGAAAVLVHDPELRRRRSIVAVGVLGALAITLRHTGPFWVATLLPLLWPARRRALWVLGSWAVALAIPVPELAEYLALKGQSSARYALLVPSLAWQLDFSVGWGVLALGLVGAGLVARARAPGPWLTVAAWVGGPLALVAVFDAGIENHTLFGPGLALLAGVGLGRVRHAAAAVAVGFGLFHATGQLGLRPDVEPIFSMERPYSDFGEPELRALFDASCPEGPPRSCRVLTSKGLFHPYSTSRGELELLILDEPRVRLTPAQRTPAAAARQVQIHALAEMVCTPDERSEAWSRVEADDAAVLDAAKAAHDLQPVWSRELSSACTLVWSTPGGGALGPMP